MPVTIKTPEEIEKMRVAGRLAAEVLDMIAPHVVPGVTTGEIDRICHEYIVDHQRAIPAPLNYKGFPRSICTSVNHQVCHGIPGEKRLKKGDIINIDVTVIKDGYHGDTSRMYFVGEPSIQARRLVQVTHECMIRGIEQVRPGARLGDVGHAIQSHAERHGFSVVREYCGHGIGREFHEDPQVLHYGRPGTGMELVPGLIFTVEPMINAGRPEVKLLPDRWTVVTRDHSLSAQWEHTVLVTGTGYEILTQSINRASEPTPPLPGQHGDSHHPPLSPGGRGQGERGAHPSSPSLLPQGEKEPSPRPLSRKRERGALYYWSRAREARSPSLGERARGEGA